MTPAATNPVQVLAKASAVLDALADHGELTPAQLAEALGEPRSSVYRLLSSLQETGLIEPGASRGTFRLGLRLFRLGGLVAQRFDEREQALPVMRRLHDATGETVFLCVRRDDEAVCIERLDGNRVQSLALRLGGSLPLHVGAAPRTLLAFESPEFQDAYLARARLDAYTDATPITTDRLRELLEQTRRDGFAVSDEDVTLGIAALGAPIFDHTGRIRAALSISGVRPAILGAAASELPHVLVESAREISHSLGH